MTLEELAEVRELSLDEVFDSEDGEFTPELADHIDKLSAALGIEIETEDTEQSVGDFSADIFGRSASTNDPVVIENQFGDTDHNHLGKLLTYAAGLDAGVVIWLAEEFREEHRSVLEWLNESGPDDARFFGVRPRVVQLVAEGEDPSNQRGFEFEVVVSPNQWESTVKRQYPEVKEAYQRFFSKLVDAYHEQNPMWNKIQPQPQTWIHFGRHGVKYRWAFYVRDGVFVVEIYIDRRDKEVNRTLYDQLREDKEEIEAELGDVTWEERPNEQSFRIRTAERDISGKPAKLSDDEEDKIVEWAVDAMDDCRAVFDSQIEALEEPDK